MIGLQTISCVLSSDGPLEPVCVCKFNLGSLHITMKIAGLCYMYLFV